MSELCPTHNECHYCPQCSNSWSCYDMRKRKCKRGHSLICPGCAKQEHNGKMGKLPVTADIFDPHITEGWRYL